jgi:hypothetical protein
VITSVQEKVKLVVEISDALVEPKQFIRDASIDAFFDLLRFFRKAKK